MLPLSWLLRLGQTHMPTGKAWSDFLRLELTCSVFLRLAQTYSNLFKLIQTCSNLLILAQTCSNLFRLAQTCSDLLKRAQMCSNVLRLAQTWSNLLKCAQTCSDLLRLAQTCCQNWHNSENSSVFETMSDTYKVTPLGLSYPRWFHKFMRIWEDWVFGWNPSLFCLAMIELFCLFFGRIRVA